MRTVKTNKPSRVVRVSTGLRGRGRCGHYGSPRSTTCRTLNLRPSTTGRQVIAVAIVRSR